MQAKTIEEYRDKTIKLTLGNGDFFTGRIVKCGVSEFSLIDRFGYHVTIAYHSVLVIREVAG